MQEKNKIEFTSIDVDVEELKIKGSSCSPASDKRGTIKEFVLSFFIIDPFECFWLDVNLLIIRDNFL